MLRDRLIQASADIGDALSDENHVGGAAGQRGPYLPPAPVCAEMLFNGHMLVQRRMKIVALVAQLWHFDRFADNTFAFRR